VCVRTTLDGGAITPGNQGITYCDQGWPPIGQAGRPTQIGGTT